MKTFFAKILYFFKWVFMALLELLSGGSYYIPTLKERIVGGIGLILIIGIVIGVILLVYFLKVAS